MARSVSFVILLAGCDPMWHMRLDLRSPNECLVDAQVQVVDVGDSDCHFNGVYQRFTLRFGSYDARGIGLIRNSCRLEIRAPGFRPYPFRAGDECEEPNGPYCRTVHVVAKLTPLP